MSSGDGPGVEGAGKSEEALNAFCEIGHPEASALRARFAAAQKEFSGGRIEFKEFEKMVNQINAGLLGLLE